MPVSTKHPLSSLIPWRVTCAACILLAATVIAVGFRSTGSVMLAEASFRQGHPLNTAKDLKPLATLQFNADHLWHGRGN